MKPLVVLSKITILFLLFIVVNYSYIGITTNPTEGDSLNYHIPIAKAYLNGTVFSPYEIQGVKFLKFSPGLSEGVLASLYLLHIPPNLFNVFGVIFLFIVCYFLGKKYELGKELSIVFATSIATLNGIVRWMDSQIIDIYLATFFAMSLLLLRRPQKSIRYFMALGAIIGMLIGSKYSGLLFSVVLFIVFGKRVFEKLSFKRFIAFCLPVLLLGGSWYIRNYIATGNPLYPQGFLFFKDFGFDILDQQVWRVAFGSTYGFVGTLNAFISEYMIWVFAIPVVIFVVIKKINDKFYRSLLPLLLVGLLSYGIYMFLPSDNSNNIMVSVIRYSYPAFIPFLLCLFVIGKKKRWDEKIAVVAIANMLVVGFPMGYNPKILFLYIPLALIFYFKLFNHRKYS